MQKEDPNKLQPSQRQSIKQSARQSVRSSLRQHQNSTQVQRPSTLHGQQSKASILVKNGSIQQLNTIESGSKSNKHLRNSTSVQFKIGKSFIHSDSNQQLVQQQNQQQSQNKMQRSQTAVKPIKKKPLKMPKPPPKKVKEPTFDEILTSQWDKDMQKYRYKNTECLDFERKEKIHKFIFEKKKQNSLKYSSKSKINVTALPVPRGTVSIMLNVDKKDYGFNLANFKKKIPQKSKFKMKWKTIQWLLNNKKDAIKQLFNNYNLMLKYARGKKGGMNRAEFGELLSYVGLGADENLADKLFYIFDDDNSQSVDYKELIIGLETFKESTMDDKLKVFMEICDDDGNGKVTKEELYQVLKQNLFNYDDKVKLREIVRNIFKENDLDKDGTLDKEELYTAVTHNQMLRGLLEESVRNVKRVDQMIENDLEEPFHAWVPISANFVNYKEGIHFKLVDKYMNILQNVESTHANRKNMKSVYKEAIKLSKPPQGKGTIKEEQNNNGDSYDGDDD